MPRVRGYEATRLRGYEVTRLRGSLVTTLWRGVMGANVQVGIMGR